MLQRTVWDTKAKWVFAVPIPNKEPLCLNTPEDLEVDWVDFILVELKDSILAWEEDLVYQDSVFHKDNLDLVANNPDSEDNILDKDLLKVSILLKAHLQDNILLKDNILVNLKDHLQVNGLANLRDHLRDLHKDLLKVPLKDHPLAKEQLSTFRIHL